MTADEPGRAAKVPLSRHAQIVRLLDTRYDHLPGPERQAAYTTAGFVHHAPVREACPDCLANDRVMFGCETCGGRGFVESIRDRDPYAVDKVAPYGMDVSAHERRRERDAQIARLDEQTRDPWRSEADAIADANAHPYGWEIARRRMFRDFDYRALDVALDELRQAHPGLSPYSDLGLAFLNAWMPDPIRAPELAPPARNLEARHRDDPRALAQRDEVIRQAVLVDGEPTRDVALRFGLSVSQVNRVVKG